MESILQRFSWAFNFGIIGAVALLTALLINGVVAMQLSKFTVPPMPSFEDPAGQAPRADRDESDRAHWVDRLSARCLFGCPEEVDPTICPDGCPEGEVCEMGECVPEEVEAEEELDLDIPRLTELNLTLTGVLAAQNPRWSIAMILENDEGRTHIVGVGDMIPLEEPVEILEIRRDRVFIDNDGRLEFIRIKGSPDADPGEVAPRAAQRPATSERDTRAQEQRARARSRRPQPPRSGRSEEETARAREAVQARQREQQEIAEGRERARELNRGGVVQSGEGQYTVDRDRIERELENPEAIARQARIMPNYRDGEPDGLRLVGVSSSSVFSAMGIRSGDVIHSVNGNPVNTQQEAMRMIEMMGQANRVVIEIERRGQRQRLEYNIR